VARLTTGRELISLGAERYPQILRTEDFLLVGEQSDEGDNPYHLISKPWVTNRLVGPICERAVEQVRGSAGVGQREVAEAVSNRHPVTIAVYAGQRRENVHRRMRDQWCMAIRQHRTVFRQEVQQVRHLLKVRWNVRIVTFEVNVVELDVDYVLDGASTGAQFARVIRILAPVSVTVAR